MMQQLRCRRQQWNMNKQWKKRRSFIDVHLDIGHEQEHSTLFYWILWCPSLVAGCCDECVCVRTVAFGIIAHDTAPWRGRCVELNKEIASDVRVESAVRTGDRLDSLDQRGRYTKVKIVFLVVFLFSFVVLLLVRRYLHFGSIVVCRCCRCHRPTNGIVVILIFCRSKSHEQKNVYFSVRTFLLRNQWTARSANGVRCTLCTVPTSFLFYVFCWLPTWRLAVITPNR